VPLTALAVRLRNIGSDLNAAYDNWTGSSEGQLQHSSASGSHNKPGLGSCYAKSLCQEACVATAAGPRHVTKPPADQTDCTDEEGHSGQSETAMVKSLPTLLSPLKSKQRLWLPQNHDTVNILKAKWGSSSSATVSGVSEMVTSPPRSVRSHHHLPTHNMTRKTSQDPCVHHGHGVVTTTGTQPAMHRYALRPSSGRMQSKGARPYQRSRLPADCTSILQHAFAKDIPELGSFSLHTLCQAVEAASCASRDKTDNKAALASCKHDVKRTVVQCVSTSISSQDCSPSPDRKRRKLVA